MTQTDDTIRITVTEEPAPPRIVVSQDDPVLAALQRVAIAAENAGPQVTELLVNAFNAIQEERERIEMVRDLERNRAAERLALLDEMLSHARQQRDDALSKFVNAEKQGRDTERHLLTQYMAINLGLSSEDIKRMIAVLTGECEVYIPQPRMDEITEIFEDVARYVLEEEMYEAEAEAEYEEEIRRDAEQGGYPLAPEASHD